MKRDAARGMHIKLNFGLNKLDRVPKRRRLLKCLCKDVYPAGIFYVDRAEEVCAAATAPVSANQSTFAKHAQEESVS